MWRWHIILTITFAVVCSDLLSDCYRPKDTECDIAAGAKKLDVVVTIMLCEVGSTKRLMDL